MTRMAVVIVLVVLVLLIVLAGLALRRADTSTQTFPGPVASVDVKLPAGGIRVYTGGDGGVTVTREMRWLLTKPKLDETFDQGVLRLHVTGSPLFSGIVEYSLQVPAGTSLQLWSSAGTIHVRGVTGGIEARSSAGGIFLEECGGRLKLRTSAGSVEAEELTASEVDVETHAGGVDLAFVAAPERVEVTTQAGAVDVVVPDERYHVETSSDVGATTVDVDDEPAAARRITITTQAGSIRVSHR